MLPTEVIMKKIDVQSNVYQEIKRVDSI